MKKLSICMAGVIICSLYGMEQRSDKTSENRSDVFYNAQELEELSRDRSLRERKLPYTKKWRKKGDLSDVVSNTADNLKHSSKLWEFFGITKAEANAFASQLVQGVMPGTLLYLAD